METDELEVDIPRYLFGDTKQLALVREARSKIRDLAAALRRYVNARFETDPPDNARAQESAEQAVTIVQQLRGDVEDLERLQRRATG